MSDNALSANELPELNDDDIHLLHAITTSAQSHTRQDPPFKALFAAYDRIFAEQGIEQEHDGVVFRFLLRVGEAAREGATHSRRVDLVACLKSILQAQGITMIEDDESQLEDVTRSLEDANANGSTATSLQRSTRRQRRVSFNDAHLDETWLSERSRTVDAPVPQAQGQRAQPARQRILPNGTAARRARSTSLQRRNDYASRQAASKHFRPASPISTAYGSNFDNRNNPTLLFQPSQAQLEQNAEAFAATSTVRGVRRCLHFWHDRALLLHQGQQQAYNIAAAHDRRTLLKQAWDQWQTHLAARKEEREVKAKLERLEQRADEEYHLKILFKAFTHWATSTTHQQTCTKVGSTHMLRFRYFHRWRALAVESAQKVRSILARRYFALWRDRLARRRLGEERAVAVYEESRVKVAWKAWFWQFCSRRVEGWRDGKVRSRALSTWKRRVSALRVEERTAVGHCDTHTACNALRKLRGRLQRLQQATQEAQTHRDHDLKARTLIILATRTRLEPLARTFTRKAQLDLQRKALKVWRLHLQFSSQAADINRKRILQSAWTSWDDALRCKALGQKIDERVLVESLYKWVLAERAELFRRTIDAKLARQALGAWSQKSFDLRTRFRDAEAAFAHAQERRRLMFGMLKLHLAMRQQEDAERAAVEFAFARALPNVMEAMVEKLRHVQQLEKWAGDARFYTLTMRVLGVWKAKTGEHQKNRKKDAYAGVRARVKIRLVGSCLRTWRGKAAEYTALDEEAERRAQAKLFNSGTRCYARWRDETMRLQGLSQQAAGLDRQRLILSAMSVLTQRYVDITALDDRAEAFKRETELAVLAAALKKVQWAQFTAARRAESADALRARNRDVHVRNMIRTWAAQTATRRAARQTPPYEDDEPDSPSLRPASRAALRSAQESTFASSPPAAGSSTTPAYMRTPSRSRRAGRFRPLSTPAAVTPFAFEKSYLATTPAPLPGMPTTEPATGNGIGTMEALTPQVTPFARKLRAGGFGSRAVVGADRAAVSTPVPALRGVVFGRSVQIGTAKSVRFVGSSRFGSGGSGHLKSS